MVAIKNMEMPSCCKDCIMCIFNMNINNPTEWYCKLTKKDCGNKFMIERHKDCPLVEIEERKTGKWLSAEEYALRIGAEVTEDIKNSLYKFCPFCEQTVFMERNYCPNCGAKMESEES